MGHPEQAASRPKSIDLRERAREIAAENGFVSDFPPEARDSMAYKEFVATGKFPAAAHLQAKMVKLKSGDITVRNYDPPSGTWSGQQGEPLDVASEVSPSAMKPQRFTYIGPNNEPLIGMQIGNEFFDQMGNKLQPVAVGRLLVGLAEEPERR